MVFFLVFLVSSLANRIQTPSMEPLGREKFDHNPNCDCSMCAQAEKPNVPWMQSIPRFAVIDNHQRPVPTLHPIRASVDASPSATVVNDESKEMLEAQIKINAEMMQRVDTFEAERNAFASEIKTLRSSLDQCKKENAFCKAKLLETLAECEQLKKKLVKGKPDAKVNSSTNKENVNKLDQQDHAIN